MSPTLYMAWSGCLGWTLPWWGGEGAGQTTGEQLGGGWVGSSDHTPPARHLADLHHDKLLRNQAKTCSNLGPTSSKLTGHENRTVPPVSYVWGWTTTCVSWSSIWWMSSQNIVSQAGSISLHYNDSWNLVLIVVQYSRVGLQHYNCLAFVLQTYFVSFQK